MKTEFDIRLFYLKSELNEKEKNLFDFNKILSNFISNYENEHDKINSLFSLKKEFIKRIGEIKNEHLSQFAIPEKFRNDLIIGEYENRVITIGNNIDFMKKENLQEEDVENENQLHQYKLSNDELLLCEKYRTKLLIFYKLGLLELIDKKFKDMGHSNRSIGEFLSFIFFDDSNKVQNKGKSIASDLSYIFHDPKSITKGHNLKNKEALKKANRILSKYNLPLFKEEK